MSAPDMLPDRTEITLTVGKGALGLGGSFVAAISAFQEQLAWGFGILVALATLISLGLDIRRKLRRQAEENTQEEEE